MQNDILKNTIAPWQEKGRWYHAYFVSDGSAWSIDKTKSDPFFVNTTITGSLTVVVRDPDLDSYDKVMIDIKIRVRDNITANTLNLYSNNFNISLAPNRQYILLGTPSNYIGDADCWIYVI